MIPRAHAGLVATLALAASVANAFAQPIGGRAQMNLQGQIDMLRAQQELAARRQVLQQLELSRMDAQIRTQQSFASLQAQTSASQVPPWPASGAIPQIDVSRLASIPDAELAASNARVRAAANNRP